MPTLELIEHALEVGDESLLLGHVQHQAVLGDAVKILGRVDAALVQDAGDGILEELDDDVRRPAQRDDTVLGRLHRKTRPPKQTLSHADGQCLQRGSIQDKTKLWHDKTTECCKSARLIKLYEHHTAYT